MSVLRYAIAANNIDEAEDVMEKLALAARLEILRHGLLEAPAGGMLGFGTQL
jgi:hypothetical protein